MNKDRDGLNPGAHGDPRVPSCRAFPFLFSDNETAKRRVRLALAACVDIGQLTQNECGLIPGHEGPGGATVWATAYV